MIVIKTAEEIKIMREGGRKLAQVLHQVVKAVKPGISTKDLDLLAEKLISEAGAAPAFKNYRGFPASLCTSVNEEIVHGLPTKKKILQEGDIIGLDLGVVYPPELCFSCPLGSGHCGGTPGLFTDMAITVGVGKISLKAEKLIKIAKGALGVALKEIRADAYLGDVSSAIQKYAESAGFSVIRELVGHGVGKDLHESPEIPNYGKPRSGVKLKEGMTLAIEPMIAAGGYKIATAKDGFAYETADRSLAAHFEHTVAVTKNGCEILTQA